MNNFTINFYAQHVPIVRLAILIFEKTANRVRTRKIKKRELLMMFIEKSQYYCRTLSISCFYINLLYGNFD